jgi:hypothetical protein
MPHLLDKLPKCRLDIRAELEARKDNYITREEYFAICRSHGMEKDKALSLSDYLHDLGIILHFRTDPLLADTVILKPKWVSEVFNKIISFSENQKKYYFHFKSNEMHRCYHFEGSCPQTNENLGPTVGFN